MIGCNVFDIIQLKREIDNVSSSELKELILNTVVTTSSSPLFSSSGGGVISNARMKYVERKDESGNSICVWFELKFKMDSVDVGSGYFRLKLPVSTMSDQICIGFDGVSKNLVIGKIKNENSICYFEMSYLNESTLFVANRSFYFSSIYLIV